MPFGLTNAPSFYQHVIQEILVGLEDICFCYLDDVVIIGSVFDEHLENVKRVFERLSINNVILKSSKCKLFQSSIELLGHHVDD